MNSLRFNIQYICRCSHPNFGYMQVTTHASLWLMHTFVVISKHRGSDVFSSMPIENG